MRDRIVGERAVTLSAIRSGNLVGLVLFRMALTQHPERFRAAAVLFFGVEPAAGVPPERAAHGVGRIPRHRPVPVILDPARREGQVRSGVLLVSQIAAAAG
jgi:hypothetical protein